MELFDYENAPVYRRKQGDKPAQSQPVRNVQGRPGSRPAGRGAGADPRQQAPQAQASVGGQAARRQVGGAHAAGARRPAQRAGQPARHNGLSGAHARAQSRPAVHAPQHAARSPQAEDRRAYQRAVQPARRPAVPQHARRPADYPVRRRQRSGAFGGTGFFLASFAVILALSGVITYVLEAPQRAAAASDAAASSAAAQAAENEQLASSLAVAGSSVGPARQEQITVTPFSAQLYALPENGRVEMRYFDDALLIGDSLTTGFQVYSASLSGAKYAAYTGAGPQTFIEGTVTNEDGSQMRAMDVITGANAKKVYIMLGTNSMEIMQDEGFLKYYGDLLDLLQQTLPADTVFYVESILPVSAAKMEEDENFTVERVQYLNEQLAVLAAQRNMHYLDLYSAFVDESGALRSAYAAEDGVHLNNDGYNRWREYLVTHTAYSPQNPYLPGSPCYVAPPAQ